MYVIACFLNRIRGMLVLTWRLETAVTVRYLGGNLELIRSRWGMNARGKFYTIDKLLLCIKVI